MPGASHVGSVITLGSREPGSRLPRRAPGSSSNRGSGVRRRARQNAEGLRLRSAECLEPRSARPPAGTSCFRLRSRARKTTSNSTPSARSAGPPPRHPGNRAEDNVGIEHVEVVRPTRERRGRDGRREREEPGLLPHAVVSPGRDDRTLLAEEEPSVVRRTERGQVLAELGDEVRWDRHPPHVLGRSVLQSAVVAGLPRIGPLLADRRASPMKQGAET